MSIDVADEAAARKSLPPAVPVDSHEEADEAALPETVPPARPVELLEVEVVVLDVPLPV